METFDDLAKRLCDSFTFTQDRDRLGRLANLAVDRAYKDIGPKSGWTYLKRWGQINTQVSYTTGTIGFVASTRIVTLTGGTWPANAVDCQFLINRNIYRVEYVIDSTHLALVAGLCPVQDISSGASYALAQTQYLLPEGFVELLGITELERFWRISYVTPEVMLAQSQLWYTPTRPWYFTIVGSGTQGRLYMQFAPPPNVAITFPFAYQARPRLRSLQTVYTTGTIAVSASGTTVTLASGTVPKGLASGCVFRISSNATAPTGLLGPNPYLEEHVVRSRTSDTVFELQDPVVTAQTAASYSLDDPIDIEPMSMASYFDRLCEAKLNRLHNANIAVIRDSENAAKDELREARAADSRRDPAANVNPGVAMNLGEAMLFAGNVVAP